MYIKVLWQEYGFLICCYIIWYAAFLFLGLPMLLGGGNACMADALLVGTYVSERLWFTTPVIILYNFMVYHRRKGANWRVRYKSDLDMLFRCLMVSGIAIVCMLLVQIGLIWIWGRLSNMEICNWYSYTSWFSNTYGGILRVPTAQVVVSLLVLHGMFLLTICFVEYAWLIKGHSFWLFIVVLNVIGAIEKALKVVYLIYRWTNFRITMILKPEGWILPVVGTLIIGGISVIYTKVAKRK